MRDILRGVSDFKNENGLFDHSHGPVITTAHKHLKRRGNEYGIVAMGDIRTEEREFPVPGEYVSFPVADFDFEPFPRDIVYRQTG